MTTPIAPAKSHKHAWVTKADGKHGARYVEWIGTDDCRYLAQLVVLKKGSYYYVTATVPGVTDPIVCGVIERASMVRVLKKGCHLPMAPQPHTTPKDAYIAQQPEHATNERKSQAPDREPALAQGNSQTTFAAELRSLAAQFAKPRV